MAQPRVFRTWCDQALEARGINVDIVVGTSAGSVVGSLYAAGYSGFDLQKMAMQLEQDSVGDFVLPSRGFIKGELLQNFINKSVQNRPIENSTSRLPRLPPICKAVNAWYSAVATPAWRCVHPAACRGVSPSQHQWPRLCRWRPDQPGAGGCRA